MPFGGDYGYSGAGKIGAAPVMLIPGSNMDRPLNAVRPAPVGNRYGPVNRAIGVRFPVVALQTVVHASWFTAANLGAWFFTRGGSIPHDLSAIASDLNFHESTLGKHKILNPKGAGLSLNFAFGEAPLTCAMQFHGTALGVADVAPAFIQDAPLTFAEMMFGGSFGGLKIRSGSIQINPGLTPLEALNGTHYPSEHNAGILQAMVSLVVYHESGVPLPGMTDDNTVAPVTDAIIGVDIGSTITTFSFASLVLENPNARRTQDPNQRILRELRYFGEATTDAYAANVAAV